MIIKVFKISTKEMYTFKNKLAFYTYVKEQTGKPISYDCSIDDLMRYLPIEDYHRVR